MKKSRKIALLLTVSIIISLFLPSFAGGNPINFTISTDSVIRSEYCERFISLVEEASNRKYTGTLYAQNSLGPAADMAQMIQLGTLDFCFNDDMSIDGILNGALGFAWLPGLVSDYEEADKFYQFGWIADQVAKIMRENNIVRISSMCNGFRQVGNVKREVKELSDLAGLKIRTPSVPSVVTFYEKCGALPVMIAGAEVLSALQTGTVDGLDNAVFNYINQGITDVIKYITEINYCYSGACFVASPTFWDALSDEDQAMFKNCAQQASDEFTAFFRKTTSDLQNEGSESGQWIVSQPSEEMKAELQKIYEEIWEESVDLYPAEIMDTIRSGKYKDF
ncbi:MAG: TRAP transporter substrate-binding protein [Christensenellales bacterium]